MCVSLFSFLCLSLNTSFRGWPGNAQHAWFTFLSIQAASKTLIPIIIEFTMRRLGDYSVALYAVSMTAIVFACLAVYLPTPLHNEFRSVQAAMSRRNSQRSIREVNRELKRKRGVVRILIGLFGFMDFIFMMIQGAMLMFITSYCKDYLEIEHIGRYLISMYYGGQMVYRIFRSVLCHEIREVLQRSESFAFFNLLIGYVVCIALLTTWCLVDMKKYAYLLFVIFGLCGFALSGSVPLMHQLCESITPINGKISCIFTLCMGGGEGLIITFIGWAADKFTIKIQPYPAFILCAAQLLVLGVMFKLYRHYKKFEFIVMTRNAMTNIEITPTRNLEGITAGI